MTPPLLRLEAVQVSIGERQIVKNLSLEVGESEILGLVGASGSGKSMTALAIMRLLPAHARMSGSIQLLGTSLDTSSERELQDVRGRDMGIVFQEPMSALNPLMRIGDQVAETVRLHRRVPRSRANAMAREALRAVGLQEDLAPFDRRPFELSGGQRQRAAIAIAIVLEPKLLIADEPSTALDAGTQAQVLRLLEDLVRRRGMGMLLVSHDMAVIAQASDRIAVMHDGEIVDAGATGQTLRHLRHPYSRALLEAAELKPRRAAPAARALDDMPVEAAELKPRAAAPSARGGNLEDTRAVLEVRGLVREYPRSRRSLWHARPALRAVDGVSLTIHAGETVGLIGESGCGKSTLLRAILALDAPQAGEVRLLGEGFSTARGATLRRLRRGVQAVFQDPQGSFDPLWTVERSIAEPFHLVDMPLTAAERRRRVAAVLEQVGLSSADGARYSHEFSGGQRQRIAIARALVTEPKVIAFDEAVSALDVLVRGQILDLLNELSVRLELAYLFVSHDLNVVRAIADRVYVMRLGRIVEEGAAARVFGSPQHEYTRSLLAATPRIDAVARHQD